MNMTDIQSFAETQLKLLERELQAELAETAEVATQHSPAGLQRAGLAILNLQVASQRTGLGGKAVLDLSLDSAVGGGDLPEHGIRVGDIVGLKEQHGGAAKKKEIKDAEQEGVHAVVVKVTSTVVAIALDKDEAEVPPGKLWLLKLANDVTYKRMNQTMTKLQQLKDSEYSILTRVLFGQSPPTPVLSTEDVEWITDGLNASQQEAIRFALASREVALIHGPPGTGKTHTLVELILQLWKRGQRILVCGPSNISVDNVVERLAPYKVPMVRLGHPARLLPSVLNQSLDVLTKTSDAAALVQDIRKEMDEKQASIRKTRNGRERKAIYNDLRELRKEYRERERGCVDNLIRGSKVVLATLHGAGGHQLKHADFDLVIIDEASQALEAQCWVPLLTAKKVVLAGDHLQLPPTVKSLNSKSAATSGAAKLDVPKGASLERTLFDRLLALHGPSIKRMLTTQYRMHEQIMAFPSQALYESKLIAGEGVKDRLLKDLPGVEDTDDTSQPLVFYDTQGGDFPEKADEEETGKKGMGSLVESKSNYLEVALVKQHLSQLVEAGVRVEDVAVVTPYNAQLSLISKALKDAFAGIELGSVDGFQGREKEAIILSLVRSNEKKEVGFLGEKRRLNVAMTRPRRHLCVIGDSETIASGNSFLKNWVKFLEGESDLRYPDASTLAQ